MKKSESISYTYYYVQQLLNGVPMPDLNDVPLGPCVNELINRALTHRNISISTVAELAGINRSSLYKILDGSVQPQRNTLLRLALTLELNYEQTQQLLKAGNVAQLSSQRLRDRVIMAGLLNHDPLDEISNVLEDQGFPNLYAKI